MAELKPETKIERLLERMKPLADWYEKNKSSCRTIRVTPDDLKLIMDNPGPAQANGVFVGDSSVKWRKFEIKSV
jgi:hypothetical protein